MRGNMCLISAAPDLLVVLEELFNYVNLHSDDFYSLVAEHPDKHNARLDVAAAAIAKARGY